MDTIRSCIRVSVCVNDDFFCTRRICLYYHNITHARAKHLMLGGGEMHLSRFHSYTGRLKARSKNLFSEFAVFEYFKICILLYKPGF